jgi:hypothetical protein
MGVFLRNLNAKSVTVGNTTVVPISSSYTWTTTDGSSNSGLMVLSNSNQRITYNPNAVGNSGYFRTATAISGKTYCEFQVIQRSALLPNAFGVTTAPVNVFYNAGSGNMFAGNGGCGLSSYGYYNNGSVTTSASYNFVQGDRIGIAFDPTSKKLWFSKNGTWISGNPATDTSPTMTLAFGSTFYFYFAAYTCSISSGTFIYEIYPTVSSQLYAAPSGFSPYQP